MRSRFEGEAGRVRLIEALEEQSLVQGNTEAAEEISNLGVVEEYAYEENIMVEGEDGSDVFFILTGEVSILVKGRHVASRSRGEAVGEMSAIDSSNPRSATVVAQDIVVALRLSSDHFIKVALDYPKIFQRISTVLSRRLAERNKLVKPIKEDIDILIVSSVEALAIARGVQNAFKHDPFNVAVWTDGVFKPSSYPLSDLERRIKNEDFVLVVLTGDDLTESRKTRSKSVRDNVTFELGLAIGELGSNRVIQLEPLGGDVKTPSDLNGVNTVGFEFPPSRDLPTSLAPACNEIRDHIISLGPRVD